MRQNKLISSTDQSSQKDCKYWPEACCLFDVRNYPVEQTKALDGSESEDQKSDIEAAKARITAYTINGE